MLNSYDKILIKSSSIQYSTWISKYCNGGPVLSYVNVPNEKGFSSSRSVKP